MRFGPLLFATISIAGCGDFRDAITTSGSPSPDAAAADAASPPGPSPTTDAGAGETSTSHDAGPGAPDASVRVTVDPLVTGRSRLGARATGGYRPWRTGIAAQGGEVFWVESGVYPGLYAASASTPCTEASCVQTLITLTRPTSFFATATDMCLGDVNVLSRVPFSGAAPKKIASGNDEIVNLACDATRAFWTQGTDPSINSTNSNGTTSSLISSNGTPVAMALGGDQVWWVGVDISGLLGAVQAISTNGDAAREVFRFSNGFDTMRGYGNFFYYAKDNAPGTVHRVTITSGHDEVVANDAMPVTDFAIDDTWAYWVEVGDGPDYANGRVRRVAHDSTNAQTLAVSIAHPVAITVSGKTAFVAAAGTPASSYADGAILRLTIAN